MTFGKASLPWLAAAVAACAPVAPSPPPIDAVDVSRPLDTLPGGFDPALVRTDLVATARHRFGSAAVDRALGAGSYLIAKRFAGMAPPPPAGVGPDWRPSTPAALLIREQKGWMVAADGRWREAQPHAALELDALLADPRLWSEPAYIPPCPDFGANLLLLKVRGRAETIRNSTCTGVAANVVSAALRA